MHQRLSAPQRRDAIFQSAVDFAIVATDGDGLITDWNPGAERVLGWSAEEMQGQSADRIFTPEDRAEGRVAIEMRLSLNEGRASDERWHMRKDGSRFWANGEMMPLRLPDGSFIGFLKILRDFTQAKEIQGRLARSEERLNLALGASGMVGIWDWDMERDLVYADSNFARIYSVEPALAEAGAPLVEFTRRFHPDDMPAFKAELERVMAGGLDFSCEYRILQPDGEAKWVLARGNITRDSKGTPVRFPGTSVDVTARKEAEQVVLRANEALEARVAEALAQRETMEEALRQSQKMEAVGQLTGGLAHDFNNLLASISGALELMRKRIEQGRLSDLDRYVEIARAASTRAAALTHRLLAFSRRQTLDPKPTDANRLVADMEDMIRRTVGPAIATEVELADSLWPTLVDPPQLESALLNLCINARDAMPDGGRLTVATSNQPINSATAKEWSMESGDYVALYVTDTGTGMEPSVAERVFEPFFTTKPMGLGTGLGLSMVYGFAKQSGGQVRIHSQLGQGTSVCIYLPRHDRAQADDALLPEGAEAPRAAKGQTVLIVDDEPGLRALMVDVLEDLGYATLEAADGPAALDILRSDWRIDLLVTDVGLPGGMNGRQVADAARVGRPRMPVLFVTGYAESAMAGQELIGANMHVMPKPFGMDELAVRIKELLGR